MRDGLSRGVRTQRKERAITEVGKLSEWRCSRVVQVLDKEGKVVGNRDCNGGRQRRTYDDGWFVEVCARCGVVTSGFVGRR